MSHTSPVEYTAGYSFPGERSPAALPPSLWMSPASTAPQPSTLEPLNHAPLSTGPPSATRATFANSPISPNSPTSDSNSKSTMFSDIFSDELFSVAGPSQGPSPFTSPRLSGSPDLQASIGGNDADPEQLAKDDPLATQIWKMYARTKATLPHAQRMENLTWRMMALALKKKKEDEEAKSAELTNKENPSPSIPDATSTPANEELTASGAVDSDTKPGERGRRIDKGKTKVRVVGFDGANQDGFEPEE